MLNGKKRLPAIKHVFSRINTLYRHFLEVTNDCGEVFRQRMSLKVKKKRVWYFLLNKQ